MMKVQLLVASIALTGCIATVPPAVAPARSATTVSASFERTWTAAVDVFADKNVGIRTIDKSSGLIVGDPVRVTMEDEMKPHSLADCGGNDVLSVRRYNQPKTATYNVRVRGDSTRSTVLVTVRWTGQVGKSSDEVDCTSRGVWEGGFETAIAKKAENKP